MMTLSFFTRRLSVALAVPLLFASNARADDSFAPDGVQFNSYVVGPDFEVEDRVLMFQADVFLPWEEGARRQETTGMYRYGKSWLGDYYLRDGVAHQSSDAVTLFAPELLVDITFSASSKGNNVYAVDEQGGVHFLFRHPGGSGTFSSLPFDGPGKPKRVDADEYGNAWVVTEEGGLFLYNQFSTTWTQLFLDEGTAHRTTILDVGAAGGLIYVTRGFFRRINPVVWRYRQGIFRYQPSSGEFILVKQIPVTTPSSSNLWSYFDLDVDHRGTVWYTMLNGDAHHGTGSLCAFRASDFDVPFCFAENSSRGVGAAASFNTRTYSYSLLHSLSM